MSQENSRYKQTISGRISSRMTKLLQYFDDLGHGGFRAAKHWGRYSTSDRLYPRRTLECIWRPPDWLCLRENDSSPREDNFK
ncbi:hypothetical protein PoB_001999500 [Plakobranchus ocellatus]|uniref:Uncharacterized protein n=1 Tax=Plakobranchus ocellatus TaxID=259542 RepID=A0AAV3ZG21_9GAST|nr:hypothetical protein PoB_001999500 [Plakobranchus ocellatus]